MIGDFPRYALLNKNAIIITAIAITHDAMILTP